MSVFSCLMHILPQRNLPSGDRSHDTHRLFAGTFKITSVSASFSSNPSIDRVHHINITPVRRY